MTRFESTLLLTTRGEPSTSRVRATTRERPAAPSGSSTAPVSTSFKSNRDWATQTVLLRGFDVVTSALAIAALLPFFGIVAAAIKLSSPGPVLYQQIRVGRNSRQGSRRASVGSSGPRDRRRTDRRSSLAHGRPFLIYKFRTMVVNAEEYGPQWSRQGDPRITPLGRILRKTRFDETPQFFNVLRGDMSIIGPRPERPYFVNQFVEHIPGYDERLRVRPGITGLAQVTLDYDSSIDDVKMKLEQDLKLVRKRSLARDLAILLRTAFVVLTGRGAC